MLKCRQVIGARHQLCYDEKMESFSFEPGVLMTFRRFTGARLALFLFALLINLLGAGWPALNNWPALVIMLLDGVLLLVYLSLPQLQSPLKRAYLPIGIIWATVGPMVELYMLFAILTGTNPERSAFLLLMQSILVLFIPLVITAWQYSMRTVILYCGSTFLFDVLLASIIYTFFRNGLTGSFIFPPILGMAFTRTVFFFFIGNMISNLMTVQRAQHYGLVEANQRLAQYASTVEQLTISRERNRMARELHDVLAHTMSGVAVELEGVRATMRVDISQAETLLGQALRAVRDGLNETRRALQALRASPLEDLGLGLAIQNLAETIAGPAELQIEVQVEKDLPDYPLEAQQTFYRVAQETLTNVVNHAQASKVQVCLARQGRGLKLLIRDDGIGFDEKNVDLHQKYGLLGIRERVEMIHGRLSITSQVGMGTEMALSYEANPVEELNVR
jgi:signal transduction histidine kinase